MPPPPPPRLLYPIAPAKLIRLAPVATLMPRATRPSLSVWKLDRLGLVPSGEPVSTSAESHGPCSGTTLDTDEPGRMLKLPTLPGPCVFNELRVLAVDDTVRRRALWSLMSSAFIG